MNWIDVKNNHFAEIAKVENGIRWESDFIDEPFMVAIPLADKTWVIEKVVLSDEKGLELFCDGVTDYFGYDMSDVTHWCKITEPN